MTEFQRVIKYCAIAFATFLTVVIVGIILSFIFGIFSAFFFTNNIINDYSDGNISNDLDINLDLNTYSNQFYDVKSLDILNGIATLDIKKSNDDVLKVEAENVDQNFVCQKEETTLKISYYVDKSKSKKNQNTSKEAKIIVYVPENTKFDDVVLDSSIGKITIEDLNTKSMDISSNVGTFNASNISSDKTKISGGIGSIDIKKSNLKDMNLESNVGKVTIDGKITGNSKIKGGLGEINLNIDGDEQSYNITNKGGMGVLSVDGNSIESNQNILTPNKPNNIDVNLGVGTIKINFS